MLVKGASGVTIEQEELRNFNSQTISLGSHFISGNFNAFRWIFSLLGRQRLAVNFNKTWRTIKISLVVADLTRYLKWKSNGREGASLPETTRLLSRLSFRFLIFLKMHCSNKNWNIIIYSAIRMERRCVLQNFIFHPDISWSNIVYCKSSQWH